MTLSAYETPGEVNLYLMNLRDNIQVKDHVFELDMSYLGTWA